MGFIFLTLLELAAVAFHDKVTFLHEQRRRRFSQVQQRLSCTYPNPVILPMHYDARGSRATLQSMEALLHQPMTESSLLFRGRRKCVLVDCFMNVLRDPDLGPKVDKFSSIAFPIAFAIFNLVRLIARM